MIVSNKISFDNRWNQLAGQFQVRYISPKKEDFFDKNQSLFLDRDGVIIDYIPYLSKPEQVRIPKGAGQSLKRWQDAGYQLIIITNQSGIGRGYFTWDALEKVHDCLTHEYLKFGVKFHDILICPHHPDQECLCRKPSPYLLLEAAKKHHIDLSRSFFIGDSATDLDCAIQAGCQPVLLLTGLGKLTHQNLDRYPVKISVYQELHETIELLPKFSSELES